MSNTQYLDNLNELQHESVCSTEGPNLIIAGAGTGKTRVLTTRVAHIVETNLAFPSQVLCVTFTNKAAREMADRVQQLVNQSMDRIPWIGTFHSIGAKIIRNHAEVLGLKSSFTILDKDDQLSLIKQIIKAENLDQSQFSPKLIQSKIDQWKNKALNPDDIKAESLDSLIDEKSSTIYKIYQQRLFEINCLDFGDLLLQCINLFKRDDILKRYASNFKYIHVDEYQDTNAAQYIWLKLLASEHLNICCVGDDDQSIYSWRGAEVDNMLKFEKEFENAKVIRLKQNYRSTNNILKSASSLISYNEMRLGKELISDQGTGEPIYLHLVNSSRDEANLVAQEILDYKKDNFEISADKAENLERLKKSIGAIKNCSLKSSATNIVFSDGNPKSKIMLVGEAPGSNEDQEGLPFVGRAGALLDKMLASINLNRKNVYISNIINYRPPENRRPTDEEVNRYMPFIKKHIEIINPKILVLLGSTAMNALIGNDIVISKARGKWIDKEFGNCKSSVIITFHPAFLMRQPAQKKMAWIDLKMIRDKKAKLKI